MMTYQGWPLATAKAVATSGHYPSRASFGPRVRHDYEFIWMLSGEARWQVQARGGSMQLLTLAPAELALGRPGDAERFDWYSRQGVRHGYVHFDLTMPLPNDVPRVRSLSTNPLLAALCDHLLALGHEPARQVEHDAMLGVLVGTFLADPP